MDLDDFVTWLRGTTQRSFNPVDIHYNNVWGVIDEQPIRRPNKGVVMDNIQYDRGY